MSSGLAQELIEWSSSGATLRACINYALHERDAYVRGCQEYAKMLQDEEYNAHLKQKMIEKRRKCIERSKREEVRRECQRMKNTCAHLKRMGEMNLMEVLDQESMKQKSSLGKWNNSNESKGGNRMSYKNNHLKTKSQRITSAAAKAVLESFRVSNRDSQLKSSSGGKTTASQKSSHQLALTNNVNQNQQNDHQSHQLAIQNQLAILDAHSSVQRTRNSPGQSRLRDRKRFFVDYYTSPSGCSWLYDNINPTHQDAFGAKQVSQKRKIPLRLRLGWSQPFSSCGRPESVRAASSDVFVSFKGSIPEGNAVIGQLNLGKSKESQSNNMTSNGGGGPGTGGNQNLNQNGNIALDSTSTNGPQIQSQQSDSSSIVPNVTVLNDKSLIAPIKTMNSQINTFNSSYSSSSNTQNITPALTDVELLPPNVRVGVLNARPSRGSGARFFRKRYKVKGANNNNNNNGNNTSNQTTILSSILNRSPSAGGAISNMSSPLPSLPGLGSPRRGG